MNPPADVPPTSAGRTGVPWFLLTAVLLVALTLRAPIIAVAPVVDDVRSGLHIGAGTAGLLTSIPVLCFSLGTPLVLAVVSRSGIERAVLIGLSGTLLGVLIRSGGSLAAALIGTVVIGLSITVGNVVIPVIIGRDFPGRSAAVTGAYAGALNVGSMIATTATAPLAGLIGWRPAIASGGVVIVAAVIMWRLATAHLRPIPRAELLQDNKPPADDPAAAVWPAARPGADPVAGLVGRLDVRADPPLWRRPLVLGLTLAFGGQSFSYFGVTAWLPTLLGDQIGLSRSAAGASSSIFQILALVGAVAVPVLVARRVPARIILLIVCAAWIALPLGLILVPGWWPVWCAFGGAAQGGGFTTVFSVVAARARDSHEARRMSASVQGGGYIIGACGPFVIGAAHSATGGWTVPMLIVGVAVGVMAGAGSFGIGRRTHASGM